MIVEYLRLQEDIRVRAAFVGKILQKAGHYAYTGVRVPVIEPFLRDLRSEVVEIVLCYNKDGQVAVAMPTQVFDMATADGLREWVSWQNRKHQEFLDSQTEGYRLAQRAKELEILKELQGKYPDA